MGLGSRFRKHRNYAVEIKNTRLRLRYSQEQFAEILKIGKGKLSRLESGKSNPDSDIIKDVHLLKVLSYLKAGKIRLQRNLYILWLFIWKPIKIRLVHLFRRLRGRVDKHGQMTLL